MIQDYIKSFSKLNRAPGKVWGSATKNRAPHKPIFLLALLDLFSRKSIQRNFIELTPEFNDLFLSYWQKVVSLGQRSSIAFPFFHMKGEKFWHLIAVPGKESSLAHTNRISTMAQLKELVLGASIDEELFANLQSEENRNILRGILIHTYFSDEVQQSLKEQCVINNEAFNYSLNILNKSHQEFIKEQPIEDNYQSAVRDQGFRRIVVMTYNHRCALCGVRIITVDGHTVVEAAHIIPWSISHNDDIRNGLALCRLCHWAFDEGMLGVSENYEVITDKLITNRDNYPGFLLNLSDRGIIGPEDKTLWPSQESLSWHRKTFALKR
ncbi:MAG: HNH endonuclease [Candidatus Schekmanbacteria bacterium]|nr:HNH endonuclease [Candidatus Schekmanbacteria bacterium]